MLKKRPSLFKGKKAFGQVDWPISLGFFLVYLIWFFFIISPIVKTPEQEHPALRLLEEKFNEDATWKLTQAPLIVTGSITGDDEPIIVDLPLNYSQGNTYMYDEYFLIDEEKLFLLQDITTKSYFWLVHTNKTYTLPSFSSDLSGGSSYSVVITQKNFRADFSKGLLTTSTYDGSQRIYDFDITVGGAPIGTTDNEFTDNPMVHKYKVRSSADNMHYVFGDNSRIYSFIQTESSKSIEIEFELAAYTSYYFSAADFGTINYGASSCSSRTGDFASFYNANDAVTFLLGDDVSIEMCNTATRITVTFSIQLDGELSYHTIFHEGDKDEGLDFTDSEIVFGVFEDVTGLSKDLIDELSLEAYQNLKREWAFPQASNFKILVYNSTSVLDNSTKLLELGDDPYQLAEVHVKTIKTDLIDQYNTRVRSTVNLRVWT